MQSIRDNFQWIGRFPARGAPGRQEIDETHELNYRFIAQSSAELGFTGYIAHEYPPAPGHDPLKKRGSRRWRLPTFSALGG